MSDNTQKRGTTVEIPYESACRNYAMGFTLAIVSATVLFSFPLVFGVNDPFLMRLFKAFYLAFYAVGAVSFAWGYYNPVHFYETMENEK